MESTVRWQWIVAAVNGIVALVLVGSPCARITPRDQHETPILASGPTVLEFVAANDATYLVVAEMPPLLRGGEGAPSWRPSGVPSRVRWEATEDGPGRITGAVNLMDLCVGSAAGPYRLVSQRAHAGRPFRFTLTGEWPTDCRALDGRTIVATTQSVVGEAASHVCATSSAVLLVVTGLLFAAWARLAEARSRPGGKV